jgi:hypothetical protein
MPAVTRSRERLCVHAPRRSVLMASMAGYRASDQVGLRGREQTVFSVAGSRDMAR